MKPAIPVPFDVPVCVALLPILLAQALAVRRNAQILPEPPGKRLGCSGDGPPLRLLIAGDSSAAGVGADTQKQGLSGQLVHALAQENRVCWRLEAVTGATTRSTLANLSGLDPEPYDVAVLALGVNDVTRGVSQRKWVARQLALHRLLRDRFGVSRIIASGVPPMGLFPLLPQPLRWVLGRHAKRLDTALAGIAAQSDDICHIPFDFPHDPEFFARDGFHPSAKAYTRWAGILAKQVFHAKATLLHPNSL